MIDTAALAYKPGWRFRRGGPLNRLLCVYSVTRDSNAPEKMRHTQHQFEIPDATPHEGWTRWVFDRLLLIEQHEAGEFFSSGGRKPFYPNHEDAGSPYELVDRTNDEETDHDATTAPDRSRPA